MNEVFETVAEVLEELRSEAEEREYSVHTNESENADKALKTIQEIYRQFENIQQFPYIGADLSKRVSFKTDYKYVVWQDYVVLYKVVKETVEIYRVVNRYRDITKVFG